MSYTQKTKQQLIAELHWMRTSEEEYRTLVENINIGVYRNSAGVDGKFIQANQAAVKMFGYDSVEDFKKIAVRDIYQRPQERRDFVSEINKKRFVKDKELQLKKKDGTPIVASCSAVVQRDERGNVKWIEGAIEDITERKNVEEALKKLQHDLVLEKQKLEQVLGIDQRISSILDLNHLVDFVIEKATDVLEAERCSLMLLDSKSQELLIKGAKGLDEKIIKATRVRLGEQISGMVAKDGKPLLVVNIESDLPIARKNKPSYKSKSFLSVPIKLHNKLVGVVNVTDKDHKKKQVFTQIDLKILTMVVRQAAIAIENANYYRELEYLSTVDHITGLFNHRYFVRALEREIDRSKRYPKPLCLMMADIDNFKAYNDTYGHPEGDRMLKSIGNILKTKLRNVDIVCRYAGDEFVAILPETNISQAKVIASKIAVAMEKIHFKKPITLSIGMAQHGKNTDRRDLVMKADQALYQAKREGKDRISCLG